MVVHTMQWLAFVAGSTNLSINVSVSGCTQPNGVEMGIYASMDCSSFNLVSNCNTNMYDNQTWPFTTTTPLKPGCVYYLVWDGNGPNSCNVSMSVTAGSAKAPVPNTNDKITGRTLVCPGETIPYQINEILGACEYEWRVVNGTIVSENGNKVEVQWDTPGPGQICVKGKNICHQGNEVCLDVLVGSDSPPTDLGPFYVCPGQIHRIGNQTFSPGLTSLQFKNKFGCDSLVNVTVEEFIIEEGKLDTTICWPGTLSLGNQIYDKSGLYVFQTQSKVPPNCDSLVFIDLKIHKLSPLLKKSGDINCRDSLVTLSMDSSATDFKDILGYVWVSEKGDTIAFNANAIVRNAGAYHLAIIPKDSSALACPTRFDITVTGSRKIPELVLDSALRICFGDSVLFYNIPITDVQQSGANISFHSALPCDSSNIISDTVIFPDRDTILYAKATNGSCSDELALPIEVRPRTILSAPDIKICAGDTLWWKDIPIQSSGPMPQTWSFHTCPDTNCLTGQNYWIAWIDTSFWLYPIGVPCPEWSAVKIQVTPLPPSDFTIDRRMFCTGDTLAIRWHPDPMAMRYFVTRQTEFLLPASGGFDTVQNQAGIFSFCIRAEKERCQSIRCDSVTFQDALPLPSGHCISTDSSVLFHWNEIPGSEFEIVNISGQTQGISITDTTYLFNGLARGEEAKIRVIRKDSICGDQSIELTCKAIDCPVIKILNPPEIRVCLDAQTDTFRIAATLDSGTGNGSWLFSGAGITDSTLGIFDPRKAGRGVHTIQIEYKESSCVFRNQILIKVRENPLASFELDSIICQDSFLLVRFTGRKEDTTINQWQSDGGFIRQKAKDLFEMKWDKPGKKKIKLRLPEEFCQDEQERETEVLAPLERPEISCVSTDSTVTFFWKKNPRALNYLVLQDRGPAGFKNSDTSFQIRISKPGDTASIRLRMFDSGPCADVESDALQCISPACPPRNLLKDTTLSYCAHQTAFVFLGKYLSIPDSGYHFTGPQVQGDTVHFDKISEGSHLYRLFLSKGNCSYQDSILLIKKPLPKIEQISITPIPCPETDSTGAIEVLSVSGGQSPLLYSIDGSAYGGSGQFDQLTAGQHRISVLDSNGCRTDTLVFLAPPDRVQIDLGMDLEVDRGSLVEINSQITGKYTQIIWTGYSGLNCDSCTKVSFRTEKDLILVAQVSNEYGCTDEDEIKILIRDKRIFAPSSFSPNGDGVNDGFILYGPDHTVLIDRMAIYDRWGAQVFLGQNLRLNDPQNGWNGEFRGQKLLPGVYVYQAKVVFEDGSTTLVSGEITLVR